MNDLLGVALQVIDVLDHCGIRYTIGGSLASSFSGEPRASIDVDIVVDLADDRVDAFVAALGEDFYADAASIRRARQWRDVLSILLVQGNRLDEAYLRSVAAECGLIDLLERAQREATDPGRRA